MFLSLLSWFDISRVNYSRFIRNNLWFDSHLGKMFFKQCLVIWYDKNGVPNTEAKSRELLMFVCLQIEAKQWCYDTKLDCTYCACRWPGFSKSRFVHPMGYYQMHQSVPVDSHIASSLLDLWWSQLLCLTDRTFLSEQDFLFT